MEYQMQVSQAFPALRTIANPFKPIIVGVEAVQTRGLSYTIIEVQSQTSNKVYRVDMTNKRCTCPAWIFQRNPVEGRSLCKHLKSLGFTDMVAKSKSKNEAVVIAGVTLL
jgi:SWIM zinc finger